MSVAQLFDRARPAAVLGRPSALSLGHDARARNKSCPGLVALASPCAGARCGTLMQTSSCGSEFILLDGSKCAALTRWMVSTVFASKSRQEWVDVLASTGWTWPHGCEKRPDVRAVQSGQMLKSYQTFAMAVGPACLLLKSSCSLIQGELSSQGAHEAKMPKSGRLEGVNRLVHTSIFRQTKSTGTPMYLHLHPQTFRKT